MSEHEEALGMDKPKTRKRTHCFAIPSPAPIRCERPPWAVCWDGIVGRDSHTLDKDGRCIFCSAVEER